MKSYLNREKQNVFLKTKDWFIWNVSEIFNSKLYSVKRVWLPSVLDQRSVQYQEFNK